MPYQRKWLSEKGLVPCELGLLFCPGGRSIQSYPRVESRRHHRHHLQNRTVKLVEGRASNVKSVFHTCC